MSANNGNRSRFHRNRKRRLARRIQTRELMKGLADKKEAKAPAKSAA
jgi:hypothetical protein